MKAYQMRLIAMGLLAIIPAVSGAMEEGSQENPLTIEGKESIGTRKKMEQFMMAIEKIAYVKPVESYLYTLTGIFSGQYEITATGDFSKIFLSSVRMGAKNFLSILLDNKIEEIKVGSVIDLINFFLFTALDENKELDFDGLALAITSAQKTKTKTYQQEKLFNFFKTYALTVQNDKNLCDVNLKEKHLLLHLRATSKQQYRSCWLGNKKFKSFEISYLNKENTLIIRPTNAKKLADLSKPAKNKITITIQDLQEAKNGLLLGI